MFCIQIFSSYSASVWPPETWANGTMISRSLPVLQTKDNTTLRATLEKGKCEVAPEIHTAAKESRLSPCSRNQTGKAEIFKEDKDREHKLCHDFVDVNLLLLAIPVCLFILILSTPQGKCSRVKGLCKPLPLSLGYSIPLWDQPLGLIFSS